jgi:hypothetical protein
LFGAAIEVDDNARCVTIPLRTYHFSGVNMSNRREFFVQLSALGGVLAGGAAFAAAPMVAEADAQAVALGYKADATKADKAKYPKYAAGQTCGNCSLYQGKASDASAACALFPGKQVAGKAWCSAWAKKA